ncbi:MULTISPECIES: haloacid dehalogenase-like hydrolase [unclassified Bifidobacterium]|uniref:haloacid dehalogenase-like hydrolase n=1 Tax=unclassified Bifidobacterium TaxID=2608897 RepID=UPI0011285C6B|nr:MULTISPECIES: HAD family hydrolase [unclassified Bifidobacterium]TPF77327.1 haloacid dehalogenase [Bifidobacterium sp. UTCIF-1]TPF80087.1 haloacid dehalogenase [Bifidobacterium sp. UTCIF-24]TPF81360.1 haloacid dehalogenase [Bifidobacterium sp. UTCIF-3]TPF83428.1 haloacid dehalogenase [Bifidobacterium sp. UTCIF-36]TPF89728.1 haloacid dehalogenase [Bifidobacterium sp. UTBIF-56]
MRVFDFDGTIYDGESLFDLYLFSARYDVKVFRHLAPVLRYAIKYKLGKATLEQMEHGVGKVTRKYLQDLAKSRSIDGLRTQALDNAVKAGLDKDVMVADASVIGADDLDGGLKSLVNAFWDRNMSKIKPWYEPRPDDVILTASFDVTVGEACRRLGVHNLIASTIDPRTFEVTYLNFNTNKPKRLREVLGPDAVIDEFYTDSAFDQPMIDMARKGFMVKGNVITQVK